jgi:hypothetical protein
VAIDHQLLSTAHHCKWNLLVHFSVEIGYGFIVTRKLVNVDSIVLKLLHYLRREKREGERERERMKLRE